MIESGVLALVLAGACSFTAHAAPPESDTAGSTWIQGDDEGQGAPSVPAPEPKTPEPAEVGDAVVGDRLVDYLDDRSFLMGIVVLSFGLLVLVAQAMVMIKSRSPAADPMRHMIVLTVIIAALFTVATGISSESVAPAMGLFGTIVGYLLGSSRDRATRQATKRERLREAEDKAKKGDGNEADKSSEPA